MIRFNLILALILFLASCQKDYLKNLENLDTPAKPRLDTLNGVVYKVVEREDLEEYYNLCLILNCKSDESRATNCQWSDGNYGFTECTGGKCKIIETQNPDDTFSSCIGCYINDQIDHADACRPKIKND